MILPRMERYGRRPRAHLWGATALLLAASGVPAAATQAHSSCWLQQGGALNGGSNPPHFAIAAEMQSLAQEFSVPYEILAAAASVESVFRQFAADGLLLHNVSECVQRYQLSALGIPVTSPPGLGMMQLTGSTATAFDQQLLRTSWEYNLYAGAAVLADKFASYSSTAPPWMQGELEANRMILENWFMPLWFYNGYLASNSGAADTYLYRLWTLLGPMSLYVPEPIWVTRPHEAIPHFWESNLGERFVARSDGSWWCQHGDAFSGTVHPSGGSGAPPAPTDLVATALGPTTISFAWSPAAGAEGYWLDIAQSQEDLVGMSGTFQSSFIGEATSFTWQGLSGGTTYLWRVWAFNGEGGSHGYPTGPVTTPAGALPVTPTVSSPLNGSLVASSPVALDWSDVWGIDFYYVAVTLSGVIVHQAWPTASQVSFWPASPGPYVWYLWAHNASGWSGAVVASFTYGPAAVGPSAPVGLSPDAWTSVPSSPIALGWANPPAATQYEVQVFVWAGASWSSWGTLSPPFASVAFWPPTPQTFYAWRVRAQVGGVWGPWSAWAYFYYAP